MAKPPDLLAVALAEIERRSAVMVREQLWAAWGRPVGSDGVAEDAGHGEVGGHRRDAVDGADHQVPERGHR